MTRFKGKAHVDVMRTGRMIGKISHDRSEETPEAKARWFRSLSVEERMRIFCEYYDLAMAMNPHIAEKKHATPPQGRICILRKV